MKRRNVLATLGALGAGSTIVTGTGAFTSVTADRDLTVAVADDDQALLKMEPSATVHGRTVAAKNGQGLLSLEFSSNGRGDGPGTDSKYDFDDVFTITNQGTQTVYVWGLFDFDSSAFPDGSVWFYPDSEDETKLNDGTNSVAELDVGETLHVGVHLDTTGLDLGDVSLEATIYAKATEPANSTSETPGNGPFAPSDLIARYRFEDDATDETENDLDGSINGGVSFEPGKNGLAASFDGTDDYIEVSHSDELAITSAYSETAWVKMDATGGRNDITIKDSAQWALGFQVRNGTLRAGFEDESDNNYIGEAGSIPTASWTHLAVVYDGDSVRGFVDGSEVFEVTESSEMNSSDPPLPVSDVEPATNANEPLLIGKGEGQFSGKIDDLRIYGRPLAKTEIETLAGQ